MRLPRLDLIAIALSTVLISQSPALSADKPNIPPKSFDCPEARINEALGYIGNSSQYLADAISSSQNTLLRLHNLRLHKKEVSDSELESRANDVLYLLAQSLKAFLSYGQTLSKYPCIFETIKDQAEKIHSDRQDDLERFRDLSDGIRNWIRERY